MSEDFAAWMKRARLKKSMSQERLAKKVNVHINTIMRWENGKQYPPLDKAEEIINILGWELTVVR